MRDDSNRSIERFLYATLKLHQAALSHAQIVVHAILASYAVSWVTTESHTLEAAEIAARVDGGHEKGSTRIARRR
jgi:hypothetical protein